MRELVPASSWLNDTSRDFVAGVSFTGTATRPKLMVPVHTAVGTRTTSVSDEPIGSHNGRAGWKRRRAGRRSHPDAEQSREGALPGDRAHQSRRRRLLRPHRTGDAPPPPRASAHARPLPQRGGCAVVLREASPAPRTRVDPERRRARLRALRGAGGAGLAGEPRRPGAPHAPTPGVGAGSADGGRARPRPGPTR